MKYVRCKVCGYIMEADKVKDKCPACGLQKQVFEPYTMKLSPKRKWLIDQHVHPIAVHFPQVFIALLLILPIFARLSPDAILTTKFLAAFELTIWAFPFAVLGGFLTGLFDGKLRFKRLNPPLLIAKTIAGIVLQLISIAILGIYLASGLTDSAINWIMFLAVLGTICSIYLGKIGSSLFESFLPG